MFLFSDLTAPTIMMWFLVLTGLVLANEALRRSKWLSIATFVVLPTVLTFAVWPHTAAQGTVEGTWFAWAKVYSVLAGCIWFMLVRYKEGFIDLKVVKPVVALILAINIFEACLREYQIANIEGVFEGMYRMGGTWNYFNSAAGVLNALAICGWAGVFVGGKHKDMLWPDMLWFWIVGYDIWNFTFLYNSLPDNAFYTGAALILAATVPAFFGGRGAWLQHRAYTLGVMVMVNMTFVGWEFTGDFAVKTTNSPTAMWTLSLISFAFNLALFVYQARRIWLHRLNALKDEIYTDFADHREISGMRGA